MIREEEFRISRRPYAVNLDALNVQHNPPWSERSREIWRGTIEAVWFRRRRGETVACFGYLWCSTLVEPRDALHFLELHDDGRYGGETIGRWDGSGFWGNVSLAEQQAQLDVLQLMLENFPAVPPGYDGWWRF